jgi:hypothetical protein
MKRTIIIIACFISFTAQSIYAESIAYLTNDFDNTLIQNNQEFYNNTIWRDNISLLALSDTDSPSENKSILTKSFNISLHKILGWSTILAAAGTIISGIAGGDDLHCGLAGVATGLAALTCADGFYEYHGIVGLNGDLHYTMHAFSGVLATAGFATSLILADKKSHAIAGGTSGAVFLLTIAIVYF